MFVDELTITAHAGKGGDGVVRWLREWARPLGGPAGGDGGKGGDIYMRAVRDIGILSRYRGEKEFNAENGAVGESKSRHGKNGDDLNLDIPIGSVVTDLERGFRYEFFEEGERHKILQGGSGGYGNEYFKSSTNRRPRQSTPGKSGKSGRFRIEVELAVDAGLIGLPNAGKSSLLNALTSATSKVGAYPFTTLEPHLGSLFGFVLADIPGLIEGAAEGKGLGHKFLRHVKRTKMLLHCVSLEEKDPHANYSEVRRELEKYDRALLEKPEWLVLTKADTRASEEIGRIAAEWGSATHIVSVSILDDHSIKRLQDELVRTLRAM